MAKIIKKEKLADKVWRYRLDAPRIAKKWKAGQFIILRPVQNSERIPLTIANAGAAGGWIDIIFQTVGRTTILLSMLEQGDTILDLVGPLSGRRTSKNSADASASAAALVSLRCIR
jgi:ferredoxin--NADP+ reductase